MKTLKIMFILFATTTATSCGGQTSKQISNTENTVNAEKIDITGHWWTDAVIGVELLGESAITDEYELLRRVQEEYYRGGYVFGLHTEFKSDGSFESRDSPRCGTSNSYRVAGTYEYTDANHIRIYVNTIIAQLFYVGGKNGTFELNGKELGVFLIDSIADGFRLIRYMDGETKQQRLMYSDMLRNLPTITARNASNFNWVKLDAHNRDIDNHKILSKGLAADGRYAPDSIEEQPK